MLPLISGLGVVAILVLCWACSRERRAISWRLVGVGLAIQWVLGGVFLAWPTGRRLLFSAGELVKEFLALSQDGSRFVFGPLADGGGMGFLFAFQVLPTLIFFSAVMAVLYHLGVMQWVVSMMAQVMARLMGTSGAESLSACGNVFVGQTEAPLLVRPFLARMTHSELHAVMTGGFATIAGGVFALYVGMGIEAGHLMMASVMAVPAGIVCSKMLVPEVETSETLGAVVEVELEPRANVVDAAAAGASDGLKLALNVGAMLIAFLGLVACLNWLLGMFAGLSATPTLYGEMRVPLTVETLLGLVFYPLAAVMGVAQSEVFALSELLGTKIAVTELVAYERLGSMEELAPRTRMIASFALCGFANFGSVAIQIGGLSVMAPERRADLSQLAVRAMIAGALATCMTACVAGVLGGDGLLDGGAG